MLKTQTIRNSTTVDESGFSTGIIRQKNESLTNFRDRIYKNLKNINDYSYNSYDKSLGCITTLKDIDLFEVDLVDKTLDLKIEIKDNRLKFYLNDTVFHNEKLTALKFNIKVKETFEKYPQYFSIQKVHTSDWQYLKAENLMHLTTERMYLRYETNNKLVKLPRDHVTNVSDYSGSFEINTSSENLVTNETLYHLDDNVLYKSSEDLQYLYFSYKEFPIKIKWLPIKVTRINNQNINDVFYTKIKDNENVGEITNGNLVENFETHELLSQRGAKIFNKILEKQNTYWGE